MSAEAAAELIQDGMTLGLSGFSSAGYPKMIPLALAEQVNSGRRPPLKVDVLTGATVGKEVDDALASAGMIDRRMPYQSRPHLREMIRRDKVRYWDLNLGDAASEVRRGLWGEVDVAVISACRILEDGSIVPTTSVGNSPAFVSTAQKVIVEIDTTVPVSLQGMHDIYEVEIPPNTAPIPICHPSDRVGCLSIPCDPSKITAVVFCDVPDDMRPLADVDEVSTAIGKNIVDFLIGEHTTGRLPDELLPLQSGVGSVANAVLMGLADSPFRNLTLYSEVIQDSVLKLMESGKVITASASACSFTREGMDYLFAHMDFFREKIVMRPSEISNNPEIIRRLGVIAMNTGIEVDLQGNVNSSHIAGQGIMNGIGGSGDYASNASIAIFMTPSIRKNGDISCIVPRVSHVDHTEHNVDVIVTEQGIADLRGRTPKERAFSIVENCAHPNYKPLLLEYLHGALGEKARRSPDSLYTCFDMHKRLLETGSMQRRAVTKPDDLTQC